MHELSSTAGIVALAAGGVALIALIVAAVALVRLRRLRADQRVILGDRERRDLVEQAATLERHFRDLHDYVEDVAASLTGRLDQAEQRLDGAIAYRAMVRYDAYNEMSGQQSTSIALLDARRSGVVVSSIHHRDQARVYAKQVIDGRGELQLSPEGTFTEQAAQRVEGDRVPFATVHDVVEAVSTGAVERGVVPIENSLEGAVNATLDALAVDFPGVAIVGESVLAVHQALIAREPIELDAITQVSSHPQGLAQCARFLREHLPSAHLVATTSTAEAVRSVVASPDPHAAIAPARAAHVHGGVVLQEHIEDDPDNATRFVVLALASARPPAGSGPFKTSVLFAGAGDSSPGWLVRCLSEFAFRGVNLTKIESRPRRRQLGHYLFLVDLEGAASDPAAADAIEGLRKHCEEVRVLGTYEAAPDVSLD